MPRREKDCESGGIPSDEQRPHPQQKRRSSIRCYLRVNFSESANFRNQMKKRLILSILLLAAFGLQARAQRKIAGTRTADFTIVYCSALEDEEGIDAARTLRQELAGAEQPELRILPDTAFRRGRAIRLVRSEDRAPFDYAVRVSRGDLLIDGGGSWAPDEGRAACRANAPGGRHSARRAYRRLGRGRMPLRTRCGFEPAHPGRQHLGLQPRRHSRSMAPHRRRSPRRRACSAIRPARARLHARRARFAGIQPPHAPAVLPADPPIRLSDRLRGRGAVEQHADLL